MNYPTQRILGRSFGKSRAWGTKVLQFVCFQTLLALFALQTRNIPVGNTARYAPSRLHVNRTFQSKTYNSDIWYIWVKKKILILWAVRKKNCAIFTFYMFNSICNFRCSRHSLLSHFFAQPPSLHCEDYVCLTARDCGELPLLQITLRVTHFYTNQEQCEVLTGYWSLGCQPGSDWANTWHWTGLTVFFLNRKQ